MIKSIVDGREEFLLIRRTIHAFPELSYEEFHTSDLIAATLDSLNISVVRGVATTGVIGILQGSPGKRAIGLRADMDALPVQELNAFEHRSLNPGKMHACGHDGHTAMLLAAARYLSEHRHFAGTVYFIFQPAEEGGAGARKMIEEGLFTRFPMDAVSGMHNWPGMPVGMFGIRPGPMMASSNEFKVVIEGKGCHAAQPHRGVDPVVVAVQIAQCWQTIVSRNTNPVDAAVLSITQMHAGTATNIIPDDATLIGTVRTFSLEVLDLLEDRMKSIAKHTAEAFGASIYFEFKRNYPPLINHANETALSIRVLNEIVGEKSVNSLVEPTMGAEDFAFMLQKKAGCYVFIGNGDGHHRAHGHGLGPCNLHNASYDFNDELLPLGATYWVRLAEAFLSD